MSFIKLIFVSMVHVGSPININITYAQSLNNVTAEPSTPISPDITTYLSRGQDTSRPGGNEINSSAIGSSNSSSSVSLQTSDPSSVSLYTKTSVRPGWQNATEAVATDQSTSGMSEQQSNTLGSSSSLDYEVTGRNIELTTFVNQSTTLGLQKSEFTEQTTPTSTHGSSIAALFDLVTSTTESANTANRYPTSQNRSLYSRTSSPENLWNDTTTSSLTEAGDRLANNNGSTMETWTNGTADQFSNHFFPSSTIYPTTTSSLDGGDHSNTDTMDDWRSRNPTTVHGFSATKTIDGSSNTTLTQLNSSASSTTTDHDDSISTFDNNQSADTVSVLQTTTPGTRSNTSTETILSDTTNFTLSFTDGNKSVHAQKATRYSCHFTITIKCGTTTIYFVPAH